MVCFCSEISFQRCPTRTLFIRIFRVLNTVQSFIFKVHVVAVLSGNVRYFITLFSLCQQLFHLFSRWSAEGGIWTLAPLLTTCTLSRGVPSASWVLLQSPDAWTSVNIILSSASLLLVQRREWDSNPRALADKRFSRPPRYDHFDISPQTCSAILSKLFVFVKNFFEVFHRMFRSFSFVTRDIDEF